MANLTNVTNEPQDLSLALQEYRRVIQPGETVDISDYILPRYVWPAATWRIDGTKAVELVGDAYAAPPEPALVDVPLPDKNEE